MGTSDLRGASAEALAVLEGRLDGVGGEEAAGLGDDLLGVVAVLRAEPGLRRVATDVSTDKSAKSGLVRQVFTGKIGERAVDLLAAGVERRWTRTRDLADALEHLGVVALVNSADDAERLSDELFSVGQLIKAQSDLRTALSDPARSLSDRRQLLQDLLGAKTVPATQRLAAQALTGGHRSVGAALEDYQKIAAEAHDKRVARVYVAQEPEGGELERLRAALSNQYGRTIHLDLVVDAQIIGGMRVEIGDDVIDGTVSGRLDDARRRLAG